MRYLRILALTAIGSFTLVWFWVAVVPMAFMDPEYASWRAKQVMLDRCDLGEVLILGDSRAAADILPERLPFSAVNLAVGGGEAIEALSALTRALRCHPAPRMVIVSLDPGHFTHPDMFWDRSVRFGFLSPANIATLREASRQTGDVSVYDAHSIDRLPTLVRDWLYEIRFPSLYFSSLVHGGGLFRWAGNLRTLTTTVADRGHYYFGTDQGSSTVALDGHMEGFTPLPILDSYFNRILFELDRRGIETRFIAMPVNDTTWTEVQPAMRAQFAAYLAGYERRYPHFHVASDLMPHWPDRYFGDMFCHLNPEGAERFSAELARQLRALPEMQDTASASLVPLPRRGS